jgi:hypothetical protein
MAYTPQVTTMLPSSATSVITYDRVDETESYLALLVGGGVAIHLNPKVSVDIDLRGGYGRGDPTNAREWGRIGVGASYRF